MRMFKLNWCFWYCVNEAYSWLMWWFDWKSVQQKSQQNKVEDLVKFLVVRAMAEVERTKYSLNLNTLIKFISFYSTLLHFT